MPLPPKQDDGQAFLVTFSLTGIVFLYLILAAVMIARRPGLHYDEALPALAPVHLLASHGRAPIPVPHDPDTWLPVFGRWVPLMELRYVGAVKEYLLLPVFALFGPKAAWIRIVSALLGAVGVFGVGRLLSRHWSAPAGMAAAFLIAINPSYIDQTVFDHGTIATSMAAFGLIALAWDRYLTRQTLWTSLFLGLAAGLSIWARANLLWFLLPLAAAILLVAHPWRQTPWSHWVVMAAGTLAGSSPFLVYQFYSRGGTWQALSMYTEHQPVHALLPARLKMLGLAFISNAEHRAMWNGGPVPAWETWLFPTLAAVGLVACLVMRPRSRMAMITSLTLAGFTGFLLTSRLQVSEHHLVALLPLAVVVAVLGFSIMARRWVAVRYLSRGIMALYVGVCAYWLSSAAIGLNETRGVGPWSDAMVTTVQAIERNAGGRPVTVLDWGLGNSLYVLSGGRIVPHEVYEQQLDAGSWRNAFRNGGIFVINGPAHRFFPAPAESFLDAVAGVGNKARRISIPEHGGAEFAEVVVVAPVEAPSLAARSKPARATRVLMSDPAAGQLLHGFYSIEPGGWRWTGRNFSIRMASPDPADSAPVRLIFTLYVPEVVIEDVGPISLVAKVGEHRLAASAWPRPGRFTYVREIEAGWLKAAGNRIDFTLDKSLAPGATDNRELGIIAIAVTLEAR
ncbi:MAG: glycosyltransferase family 39 protein [Bryobacterales bacterium]|nr:glycosyltransferase family 39 protein [Bryobacterales bacterium]